MTPFVRAYEREHLRVHRSPVGSRRFRVVGLAESRADQAPKRSALQTSAYARRSLRPLFMEEWMIVWMAHVLDG